MTMFGIDTNILVRYITQDGEEAPAVTQWLEQRCEKSETGYICSIVLCELVWVLRRAYKYDKRSIILILEKLFTTAEFQLEDATVALNALKDYRNGQADFPDYLIGQSAIAKDAYPIYTLDKKAARNPAFALVQAVAKA